jgi:hypothetical protein
LVFFFFKHHIGSRQKSTQIIPQDGEPQHALIKDLLKETGNYGITIEYGFGNKMYSL